jgi:hypothetical protein
VWASSVTKSPLRAAEEPGWRGAALALANGSGGSILFAVLAHTGFNTVLGWLLAAWFATRRLFLG